MKLERNQHMKCFAILNNVLIKISNYNHINVHIIKIWLKLVTKSRDKSLLDVLAKYEDEEVSWGVATSAAENGKPNYNNILKNLANLSLQRKRVQ